MITQTKTTSSQSTSTKMSYEAYLAWAGEDTRAEWVDGEVILFMPAKQIHQQMIQFLYELLVFFVRLHNLGQVAIAPFEMKLRRSSREPDILYISQENLSRLSNDRLQGPADLVVEVISGDSVQRDRRDKYKEYREAGIREYWLIDPRPNKQRADFYFLDENGDYTLYATEEDEQVNSHILPGFWLRPSWLWQIDQLDPFVLFCEMRGLTADQINQIQQLLRGQERP